ncbi:MAG TPA: hypothetical protein VFZ79_19615 [Acidimicrobiales bacterium]
MRFLLLHSPLVGPATWRCVGEELAAGGHDITLPDLRAAAVSGEPLAVVRAALEPRANDPMVVVGHSGAGFFLPSTAAHLGELVSGLVFVDAGLPPCEGEATLGADLLEQLRQMARDGILPKWSTWWGEGVMEALVPDAVRRAEIEVETPEVPLALYEASMTQPVGWCNTTPAGFLLLSDAYRQDADRARSLGWNVIEDVGNHLDLVNRPKPLARHIVELVP